MNDRPYTIEALINQATGRTLLIVSSNPEKDRALTFALLYKGTHWLKELQNAFSAGQRFVRKSLGTFPNRCEAYAIANALRQDKPEMMYNQTAQDMNPNN